MAYGLIESKSDPDSVANNTVNEFNPVSWGRFAYEKSRRVDIHVFGPTMRCKRLESKNRNPKRYACVFLDDGKF